MIFDPLEIINFIHVIFELAKGISEHNKNPTPKNEARQCLKKANRAYRQLTGCKAFLLITEVQFQKMFMYYKALKPLISQEMIQEDLERNSASTDPVYIILLSIAVERVIYD